MSDPKQIGKMGVEHRAIKIEELNDRVKVAVALFQSAQKKFEKGEDSLKEWENIIKVLRTEMGHIERFIAVAYHNIGVIFASRRRLEEAKKYFEKALEIDENYGIAYYNLSVVYRQLGDIVKAKLLYEKALSLGYSPKKG